jgi:hypothetical protein
MAIALALSLACACAKKVDGAPQYASDQCRRVAILDEATGEAVIGAEDLAFDTAGARVLISAYDRRRAERDVRERAFDVAEGGVYAAPFSALVAGETILTLPSIVARDSVAGGLRPHGVAFDAARREILFINRAYQKIDGKWRMTPRLERAGPDAAALVGDGGDPRCSANDVAILGDATLVSFDHADCGWRGGLEDLISTRASGVETADGARIFAGVAHANGVAVLPSGDIALAATRDKAVFVLAAQDEGFGVVRRIDLPGAPDNLTVTADGMIVAALHPALLGIGLQRRLGLGRAGSRIVRVDPVTGATALLFDDAKGETFSAATAAVEAQGILVIGSVLDRGLLVCTNDAEAP